MKIILGIIGCIGQILYPIWLLITLSSHDPLPSGIRIHSSNGYQFIGPAADRPEINEYHVFIFALPVIAFREFEAGLSFGIIFIDGHIAIIIVPLLEEQAGFVSSFLFVPNHFGGIPEIVIRQLTKEIDVFIREWDITLWHIRKEHCSVISLPERVDAFRGFDGLHSIGIAEEIETLSASVCIGVHEDISTGGLVLYTGDLCAEETDTADIHPSPLFACQEDGIILRIVFKCIARKESGFEIDMGIVPPVILQNSHTHLLQVIAYPECITKLHFELYFLSSSEELPVERLLDLRGNTGFFIHYQESFGKYGLACICIQENPEDIITGTGGKTVLIGQRGLVMRIPCESDAGRTIGIDTLLHEAAHIVELTQQCRRPVCIAELKSVGIWLHAPADLIEMQLQLFAAVEADHGIAELVTTAEQLNRLDIGRIYCVLDLCHGGS